MMFQQPQTRIAIVRGIPIPLEGNQAAVFESARKQMMASDICAIISLFIGGVVLSTVALVLAIFARKKFLIVAGAQSNPSAQQALRRTGTVVVAVSAIALALNVITLIVFYPMLVQMIQTGDVNSFFGGGASSGTSTNGKPLFG